MSDLFERLDYTDGESVRAYNKRVGLDLEKRILLDNMMNRPAEWFGKPILKMEQQKETEMVEG